MLTNTDEVSPNNELVPFIKDKVGNGGEGGDLVQTSEPVAKKKKETPTNSGNSAVAAEQHCRDQ